MLRKDPPSGHLFAFYNRRRNRMKVLVWQPSGFLIVVLMFEGIDLRALLGAILIKARAVEVDDVPEAQLGDLAFLLALVPDPRALGGQQRGKERSWLRRRKALVERTAKPWRNLSDEDADNGHIAFRILAGL